MEECASVGEVSRQGIGPTKVESYGADVVEIVARFSPTAATTTPRAAVAKREGSVVSASVASFFASSATKRRKNAEVAATAAAAEDTQPREPPRERVTLEALQPEQRAAASYALRGLCTFLSGSAGTGKSFVLRYLIEELRTRHGDEGVAARNARVSGFYFGSFLPQNTLLLL